MQDASRRFDRGATMPYVQRKFRPLGNGSNP